MRPLSPRLLAFQRTRKAGAACFIHEPGPRMHVRASRSVTPVDRPLVGRVGQLAYWFDGELLRLRILSARHG